jgi:hypothetical protein
MMSPHYSDYGGRSAVRLRRSCFAVDEPGLQPTVSRNGAICPLPGIPTMADGSLGRIIWRVVDAADYWLTQARLGRVDAVRGPVPPTVADEMRKAERERPRRVVLKGRT